MDRGSVEYDIDACNAEYDDSETGVAAVSPLSESLTIYHADKKVVVHCRLVLIVIRGSVRSITGHGGEMKYRSLDQTLGLDMGQKEKLILSADS